MSPLDGLQFGWRRRLPMILQTEAAECGLACLAMIAGYFGCRTDLTDIRRRYNVSLRGANLTDLVRVAERLGLATRPVRLELAELPMLRAPCILHWDLNHFVVMKSAARGRVVIYDPSVGVWHMSRAEASKHFTGVALELTPTSDFVSTAPTPRVKFTAILGRMVGVKRALLQLLLMATAIEVIAVVSPLLVQWVVDHALLSADYDLLLTLVLGFTLLLLINTAISSMRGWMLMAMGASLKVQARTNLFSHLINLPATYFETRHMGDVLSRFNSQDTILEAITTEFLEIMLDGLFVGLTLCIMFLYSPKLAGIVVVGACLYGILRWLLYRPLRQSSAEAIVWEARQDSHFLETLRGIKTIKLFNGLDGRRSRWLNLLIEAVNRQLTTEKLRLVFKTGNALLLGGLTIIVVWLGAQDVMANALSVGMLLAFIAYKDQFLKRVSGLINRFVDLLMLRLHAERLADIALTAPEPRDDLLGRPPRRGRVAIEARNLSFRYSDNDPWILDDVDFRVEPGESVAVAGGSGCGKTTLLKLLAGLLPPTKGEILVDGKPLAQFGVEAYRGMIGVVMQDDQLFAGSVQDNISFFSETPDFARIEDCAKLAAVHDDVQAMAMGYQTLIGDMGAALSGGQKQRLLIARALYHQPSILLLDEATSHLDVRREQEVSAAIGATKVTRIIVAHRPETIRTADRIIGLENGKIVKEFLVVVDCADRAPATNGEIGTEQVRSIIERRSEVHARLKPT
jgi:ATP-binding cassette, subfamily B, bacterial CvaB/MchF/RaxB